MSGVREHTKILYYPATAPGKYSQLDTKYNLPLKAYAGGETLAKIICERIGGIDIIHRTIDSDWKESISIRNRITDIQVIHTWHGINYTMYDK